MSDKQALAVIYRSENGRTNWEPVSEHDVPEWVKDPRVMSELMHGKQAMDCREGDSGSFWYRAVRCLTPEELRSLNKTIDEIASHAHPGNRSVH